MQRFFSIVAVAVLAVFASVSMTRASIIGNGSFETSTSYPPDDSYTSVPSGALSPWNGSTRLVNGNPLGGAPTGAEDGAYYVNLNNSGPISQSFSVDGGVHYEVSFYEGARSPGATILASIALDAGTGGTSPTSFASTNNIWVQHTFQFTPSTTTTATLTFVQGDALEPYLDNVSVVALPEPTGMAALGAAGALVALKRRRR